MKLYRIDKRQWLPVSPDEAWTFFSAPGNLQEITPDWLDFQIESPLPERMYAGLIIEYRVQVFPGIRVRWITEITHIEENVFFIDEQRFGPYAFWHHQHHFLPVDDGVEIRDIVHYGMPFGPLGRLVRWLVIRGQLQEIFEFRYGELERRFR